MRRHGALLCFVMLTISACASSSPVAEETSIATTSSTSTTVESSTTSPTTTEAPETTTTSTTTTSIPEVSVRTGAGVLVDSDFAALDGQRVGLIAHQNSVVDGIHLADLLHDAPNVTLVAMFGPEHGVRGTADAGEYVEDAVDPQTGVPIYSLFGPTRQPTAEMLEGIDVLVYDLQDVGARYYTYISTMGLSMQTAAVADVDFLVLERPNPLGNMVGGGVLETDRISFVGQYPIPDVYGLTSYQLAQQIVTNQWLPGLEDLSLDGVATTGWDPSMRWEDSGLAWIPPSPAITTPDTALLYPATVYFESTNLSYGRGTDFPFEVIAAPWLDAEALRDELTARALPGVNYEVTTINPAMLPDMTVEPAYLGETLPALRLIVTDPATIRSPELGAHLLDAVFTQARAQGINPLSRPDWMDQLSGSTLLRETLTTSEVTIDALLDTQRAQRASWQASLPD